MEKWRRGHLYRRDLKCPRWQFSIELCTCVLLFGPHLACTPNCSYSCINWNAYKTYCSGWKGHGPEQLPHWLSCFSKGRLVSQNCRNGRPEKPSPHRNRRLHSSTELFECTNHRLRKDNSKVWKRNWLHCRSMYWKTQSLFASFDLRSVKASLSVC